MTPSFPTRRSSELREHGLDKRRGGGKASGRCQVDRSASDGCAVGGQRQDARKSLQLRQSQRKRTAAKPCRAGRRSISRKQDECGFYERIYIAEIGRAHV